MKKRYINPSVDISLMVAGENILLLSTEKGYGTTVEYDDDIWLTSTFDMM